MSDGTIVLIALAIACGLLVMIVTKLYRDLKQQQLTATSTRKSTSTKDARRTGSSMSDRWIPTPGELHAEVERPRILPTHDELRKGVEQEIRDKENTDAKVEVMAAQVIEQIRDQIHEHGTKLKYFVRLDETVWLIQRDLWNRLINRGWYITKAGAQRFEITHSCGRYSEDQMVPSHSELSEAVEENIFARWSQKERSRARELAVDVLAQAGEEIRRTGRWNDYQVRFDAETHWLTLVKARRIVDSVGWYASDNGAGQWKLHSHDHRSKRSTAADLPTPSELRNRIIAEIRAAQTPEERDMAFKLARAALAEAKAHAFETGVNYEHVVDMEQNHSWLVLDDTRKLIESVGWYVFYTTGSSAWKLQPDNHRTTSEDASLPSPKDIREQVEAKVRAQQSAQEKGQAEKLAKQVVEKIREKMSQGESIDFEVDIGEDVHWLVQKDLIALLEEADWSAYMNSAGKLAIRKRYRGGMIFI